MKFDYSQLATDTRDSVQRRVGAIRSEFTHTVQGIIKIGRELIELREDIPHGLWLKFLEDEFSWSDETARKYMKVAIAFPEIPTGLEFEAKALYLLANTRTPESAREEALIMAQEGTPVTYKVAQDITKRAIAAGVDAAQEILETHGYISIEGNSVKYDHPLPATVIERVSENIQRQDQHVTNSVNKRITREKEMIKFSGTLQDVCNHVAELTVKHGSDKLVKLLIYEIAAETANEVTHG